MRADEVLAKTGKPKAAHYADYKEMLAKEDIEGVIIATPLWAHAEQTVTCLDAGKHVLCEKMMAWDVEGCERMRQAARRTGRVLEIGYQRFYSAMYQAAYQGIIKAGTLGDIYTARIAWHRNGNWRRAGDPPTPAYDPSPWGYKDWEHLLNWRLYKQYSRGLLAELASHQVNIVNWFFGAVPEFVHGSGSVARWKDGREVDDHVYATFEYSGGRTATFSSIESNAFDHFYEAFFGTKGTLVLKGETEAYLFEEGGGAAPHRHRSVGGQSAARCSRPLRAARPMPRDGPAARRLPAATGWPRIDTRSPGSARLSAPARRWPAAPTRRLARRWRACAPSMRSNRRRASAWRRRSGPSRHAVAC